MKSDVISPAFSQRSGNVCNEVPMRKKAIRHIAFALILGALPTASFAFVSVGVSITVAPPALPVYVQPPCPAVGYIWTPGYWAYDSGDYYWVPGTWIMAPSPGLLWTPGYWGWGSGAYLWHAGYWGPHVGFYGGVNYGYGYGGVGFEGGYWRGRSFFYNRSVANIGGAHFTNVYNRTVVNNITVNRVSYNGGTGGINAHPSAHELIAEHDHHVAFTGAQRDHEHLAAGNRELRASFNHGRPAIAATARPAVFSGHGVVGARAAGGPMHGPAHGNEGHGAETRTARLDRPPNATGAHGSEGGTAHIGSQHGRGGPEHVGGAGTGPAHGAEHPEFSHAANGHGPANVPHPQDQHGAPHSPDFHGSAHPQEAHSAPHPQSFQGGAHPQEMHGGGPHPPQAHAAAPRPQPQGQPQGHGEHDDHHGHR
jgi:hypothetical protein